MKANFYPVILLAASIFLSGTVIEAQIVNPKDVVEEEGTNHINSGIEEGVDKGFDKLEEGIGKAFKKKNKDNGQKTDKSKDKNTGDAADNKTSDNEEGTEASQSDSKKGDAAKPQKLESYTQYDFVPGDQILFFEDFSQDEIGDFPALWTSNGSGEVKTVNIAQGKWLHMNADDAVYCYTRTINFPENFIIEFDVIPDSEDGHGAVALTLYEENPENPKEINDDLFPGNNGLKILITSYGWETKGYSNTISNDWIVGESNKNPVIDKQENHVIIWVQKRRVRIYHQGAKVLDVPTNIYQGTRFNKLLFSLWDLHSKSMISNIKVTTASPDTRSKLITEGKLVTYGITFDVNKADIKPESFGTLKSIADVLKENPSVNVKIVGHTDSDGDDAKNLDLSKRRAESVKNELAKSFGIAVSRMETEGAGESKPVAPNDTPANKALNRRVEFIKK